MRGGDAELVEEHVRHVGVVMLAGVDENFFKPVHCREGAADRGRLDELRARAQHGDDSASHRRPQVAPSRRVMK